MARTGTEYMDTGALDTLNSDERRELHLLLLIANERPQSLGAAADDRPNRLADIIGKAFNRFRQRPRLRR
jgi:hypothetical protein